MGTKLRALLQRQKNRDLFDLNEGLAQLSLNEEHVVATFGHYLKHEGHQITRANAEERMLGKLTRSLTDDIAPLLATGAMAPIAPWSIRYATLACTACSCTRACWPSLTRRPSNG